MAHGQRRRGRRPHARHRLVLGRTCRQRPSDYYLDRAALVHLPLGIVLVLAQLVLFGPLQPPSMLGALGFLLIGLGSSTPYAVSHILRAGAIQTWNEPVAGVALGAVTGTLLMFFVNRRQLPAVRRRAAAQPGAAAMYVSVGCLQIIAQTLMIASLAHVPASIAALISMCTPLVVLPVSLVLLRNREGIGPFAVLGILITIGGVALTMLQPR